MADPSVPSGAIDELRGLLVEQGREIQSLKARVAQNGVDQGREIQSLRARVAALERSNKCDARERVEKFKTDLKAAVFDAIDAQVAGDGDLHLWLSEKSVESLKAGILEQLEKVTFEEREAVATATATEAAPLEVKPDEVCAAGPVAFPYRGSFWCVPESFQFPVGATRYSGWRQWLTGTIFVEGGRQWKIKPFRLLKGRELYSNSLKSTLKHDWTPIFSKMMQAPDFPPIPLNVGDIDDEFIRSSYEIGTEYLKSCVSYVFARKARVVNSYKLSTWSMKVKYSEIMKHGTPSDKAKLPPPTSKNRERAVKRTYKTGKRKRPNAVAEKGGRKHFGLPRTILATTKVTVAEEEEQTDELEGAPT